MSLPRIPAASSPRGWVWQVRRAYGSTVPLKFRSITYAGKTPTNDTGLTFQLTVNDAEGVLVLSDAAPDVSVDPLEVGFTVDTSAEGFEAGGTYSGELWVTDSDADYGSQLVNEFQLELL